MLLWHPRWPVGTQHEALQMFGMEGKQAEHHGGTQAEGRPIVGKESGASGFAVRPGLHGFFDIPVRREPGQKVETRTEEGTTVEFI